jgi:stalled ribosome rescue protein Dom34
MTHYHAVVWIDHRAAHILGVGLAGGEIVKIDADNPIAHVHHKAGPTAGSGHEGESKAYLDDVARHLGEFKEILIAGPAQAKLHLFKHLQAHWPQIADRVVGIESADHPKQTELLAHAKRSFQGIDTKRPQVG